MEYNQKTYSLNELGQKCIYKKKAQTETLGGDVVYRMNNKTARVYPRCSTKNKNHGLYKILQSIKNI